MSHQTKFGLPIALLLASAPLQAASLAGIWMGDTKKDPITDRPTSLAMTFDKADTGSMALRCKNGAVDFFISPNDPQFTVGARQTIALRFDTSEPIMLEAIATEPGLLAVVHRRETSVLLPFMTAKTITVRFSGTYGRDYTMQFLSVLPPNVMSKVGRVLADCDIAPYPHEEIEKALATMMAKAPEQDGVSKRAKKPRQ